MTEQPARYYAPGSLLLNGAIVLKSEQEKRDNPMVVVLAQKHGEFVTWIVRPSDHLAFAGHYFADIDRALADFHDRVRGEEPPQRGFVRGAMTLTAGEMARHLSRFHPDTPVTIGAPDSVIDKGGSEWLNVAGFAEYREDESVSLIIEAADDFDSRQF